MNKDVFNSDFDRGYEERALGHNHKAKALWTKCAEEGNERCQLFLMTLLDEDLKDYQTALYWYKKLAELPPDRQMRYHARSSLGYYYAIGRAVHRDDARAFELFSEVVAAKPVDVLAWEYLGYAYRDGRGVRADEAKARMWFEKAAQYKNPGALAALAQMDAQRRPAVVSREHSQPVSSPHSKEPPTLTPVSENYLRAGGRSDSWDHIKESVFARCVEGKLSGGMGELLRNYERAKREYASKGSAFDRYLASAGGCQVDDAYLEPLTDEEYAGMRNLEIDLLTPYRIAYGLPDKFFSTYRQEYPYKTLNVLDADPFSEEHAWKLFRPRRVRGEPFLPLVLVKACPSTVNIRRPEWEQCLRAARAKLGSTGSLPSLTADQREYLTQIVAEGDQSWARQRRATQDWANRATVLSDEEVKQRWLQEDQERYRTAPTPSAPQACEPRCATK